VATPLTILGLALFLAGPVMLWAALPDKQGHTRRFLQGDYTQALYTLAILALMVFGAGLIASALRVGGAAY
jgi:hypothetical protein